MVVEVVAVGVAGCWGVVWALKFEVSRAHKIKKRLPCMEKIVAARPCGERCEASDALKVSK